MALTSTTEPSLRGILPGDTDSSSHAIVLTVPLKESQTILVGDFLSVDAGGYWIKNVTKEAKVKGVAKADATSLASETAGEQKVSALLWGIVEVDALVQDTDGTAGYDADIDVGQAVFAGGDGGTLAADGQAVVAGDGTDGVTANAMGIALDACDGTTTEDNLYKCRVFFDGLSNVI